jgi:hypothetical protein
MKQRTQPELLNKPLTKCDWILPILLACLCFLPIGRTMDAAVEGGALVKGSTLSDGTVVIPEASGTSKAIKWSTSDLDPSIFEFDASSPTRLKVKSAGDYFLAFTGPVSEQTRTADMRSQVHFFVKKNGSTTIQSATAPITPKAVVTCIFCCLVYRPMIILRCILNPSTP